MDEVDTSGSAEYQAALSRLEEIFELQVPRSVDRVVVRRLMTLVARDHHAKVTPEVKADLEAVGAEPPALKSGALLCFGVLYQKNHRSCAVCGMAQACQAKSANVGLGEITISPQLLSASKQMRIPVITGDTTAPEIGRAHV